MKCAGLTQCAVSIDNADPAIHDRLRGVRGAFDSALRGIRYLRKAGVPCQINSYASRRVVTKGLENIIALGRRLGVLAVYIILPVAIGRWEIDFSQVLSDEEKARVRALQETTFVHLELATDKTLCGVYQKGVLFVFSARARNSLPVCFISFRKHCRSAVSEGLGGALLRPRGDGFGRMPDEHSGEAERTRPAYPVGGPSLPPNVTFDINVGVCYIPVEHSI